MTKPKSDRGAVLQFEVDISRWKATAGAAFNLSNGFGESPMQRMHAMAKTALAVSRSDGGAQ